jgi:adenylate cyclase
MPQPGTTVLPRIERRLAAILAADVVRYSRLMGADEVGTLAALKAHRNERIDPVIARHHGRIVKTTGDGLLVEFASVVDAVACAVAIQRGMLAFNQGVHVDRQIVLRIGINVGDIIIDGNDIFGDGVNVAARLEALCEPGGVCISRSANEQVRDKLSLTFADLGEQTVKNIARAIGVFGLAPKDIAALPDEAIPQPAAAEHANALARQYQVGKLAAGTLVLAALLAFAGWWALRDRSATPGSVVVAQTTQRPAAYSPQDRRQSVIVLPFENSSGDQQQDGIAAAMTRDVTDAISADPAIPTVPTATAAAYRGQTLDLHAIGRSHNVHFAVVGNVRRQEGRLIVSAKLIGTDDDRSIWSWQFDREDSVDTRKDIVNVIFSEFDQATSDAEIARAMQEHPQDLDKRDLMFAASATSLQPVSKENFLKKISLVERALALDPNYVWALRMDARLHADFVQTGLSSNPDADLERAAKSADRALSSAPADFLTLKEKSRVLRAQGDLDGAAAVIHRLIELRPRSAFRYFDLAIIMMIQKHPKEALENFMTAKRLATIGDSRDVIDGLLAVALVGNDRFAEAIPQARLAIAQFTSDTGRVAEYPWLALIAAETASGREAEARADLQKFFATPRTWNSMAEIQKFPFFAANPQLLEGLRRAGMPES